MRTTRLLLACCLLILGCAEVKDMMRLVAGLKEHFGGDIGININNKNLGISFTNNARATLPDSVRRRFADSVVSFVHGIYPHADSMAGIEVVFKQKKSAGPVNVTSESSYHYTIAQMDSVARAMPVN